MPLAADPQAAVMYPPTWLFAALPPLPAYALNIFIAFALAGLGAYMYLRRLGVNLTAAAFGATAFQYCGFMIGHRVHLSMIATAAMLGWGLWAIECSRDRPRRTLVAMPFIVYLALSGGHWPAFVNTSIIWIIYLLLRGRPLGQSLAVTAGGAAIGLLALGPQIVSSFELLAAATRQHVGFAIAGENSFPPTNIVLSMFPLLMGCRTPNRWVQQPWWGAWHLCETLGYVGLLTLVLALVALWRLWRRRAGGPWSGTVKLWGGLLLGSAVLMLGYYLPPVFWVMHKLPVLNIIRAPARWLEVADLALAVLAAIGLHVCSGGTGFQPVSPTDSQLPEEHRLKACATNPRLKACATEPRLKACATEPRLEACATRLCVSFRRGMLLFLPAVMLAVLGVMALLTVLLQGLFPEHFGGPFVGGPADVWRALSPANPALGVPWAIWSVSAGVVVLFLKRPHRRAWLLVACLVFDLLIIARAVDMPANPAAAAIDPNRSATAELVKAFSADQPFRVLHLTNDYFVRPAAALAPKTSGLYGVESLAGYGPFQTPAYAHLFGLRIFGYSRDWAWLVRRNHLLSLYNVRFLLCQEPFRQVVESVIIADPNAPPQADGPNLLTGPWRLDRAAADSDSIRLDRAWLLYPAQAIQDVDLAPGQIYRIELSARSPQGEGDWLWAEVTGSSPAAAFNDDCARLLVPAEQIGRQWRHHAWTFELPPGAPAHLRFTLKTWSETPIEVRDVHLVASCWERPVNLGGRLSAGEPVYELLASYETMGDQATTIYVYRNRLCLPRTYTISRAQVLADEDAVIEALRWRPEEFDLTQEALMTAPAPAGRLRFGSDSSGLPGCPRPWSATCRPANGVGTVWVEATPDSAEN
jgi:hypothetical protein